MSFLPADYLPYLTYATPPVVGALIGYLTNKIAIRMLFRPLKAWRVFGCRVPMTPGVIPSRRLLLAENMAEVVGDHLLTSVEIGKALQEEKFQQHLLNVIAERVGAILHHDLPSLPQLVPDKFAMYRDLGVLTLKQQLRDNIIKFVHSPVFATKMEEAIASRTAILLEKRIDEIVSADGRVSGYGFIETTLAKMFASDTMAEWLEGFIRQQVHSALRQKKSLQQILPQSLMAFLEESIRSQTPNLLQKLSAILQEPAVRNGIVHGVCGGVENFILSLGPMAPMVQNFISMEQVDQKIREYLDEKDEEISRWLASEQLQQKVAQILAERFSGFVATPLVDLFDVDSSDTVQDFCDHLTRQILLVLQGAEVSSAISGMIQENLEAHLEGGRLTIGEALSDLLGNEGVEQIRNWLKKETIGLLRSPDTLKTLAGLLDTLVDTIIARPVGKLSNLLPGDVRKEIYVSIQKITANMLAQEVPGLVQSLDIKTIVADKLNSLDLLRLERLLLSIMEEQFKYINLFGALLGFMIGCLNLLLLQLQ